jgi:hypothetical protein
MPPSVLLIGKGLQRASVVATAAWSAAREIRILTSNKRPSDNLAVSVQAQTNGHLAARNKSIK